MGHHTWYFGLTYGYLTTAAILGTLPLYYFGLGHFVQVNSQCSQNNLPQIVVFLDLKYIISIILLCPSKDFNIICTFFPCVYQIVFRQESCKIKICVPVDSYSSKCTQVFAKNPPKNKC